MRSCAGTVTVMRANRLRPRGRCRALTPPATLCGYGPPAHERETEQERGRVFRPPRRRAAAPATGVRAAGRRPGRAQVALHEVPQVWLRSHHRRLGRDSDRPVHPLSRDLVRRRGGRGAAQITAVERAGPGIPGSRQRRDAEVIPFPGDPPVTPQLVQDHNLTPAEYAGVLRLPDGWAVAFKIESHNHPSAVEPYQGAATGAGGILRDVFTMGARPVAMLNSLRFGPLTDARNRYLFAGVVKGIGDYGNCVGIPTLGGEVDFLPGYSGNPLFNAMCVGVLREKDLIKAAAHGVGNVLLAVGSRTGRDGIHGASFASEELTHESEQRRPQVQVGDPFTEKLLLEASLELISSGHIVAIQDMGAAGLTSSSAEMAARGGVGVEIDLSKVPTREPGMTPYEILLSESQERMLVVAKSDRVTEIQAIAAKWELAATPIGHVTADGMYRCTWGKDVVVEIPGQRLVDDAPVYTDRKSTRLNSSH